MSKKKSTTNLNNPIEQALDGARDFSITELEDRLELAVKCDDNENCSCDEEPAEEIDGGAEFR